MFSTIKDMPGIGFGLWKIPEAGCAEVVFEAVKAGYRHFDSAADLKLTYIYLMRMNILNLLCGLT